MTYTMVETNQENRRTEVLSVGPLPQQDSGNFSMGYGCSQCGHSGPNGSTTITQINAEIMGFRLRYVDCATGNQSYPFPRDNPG